MIPKILSKYHGQSRKYWDTSSKLETCIASCEVMWCCCHRCQICCAQLCQKARTCLLCRIWSAWHWAAHWLHSLWWSPLPSTCSHVCRGKVHIGLSFRQGWGCWPALGEPSAQLCCSVHSRSDIAPYKICLSKLTTNVTTHLCSFSIVDGCMLSVKCILRWLQQRLEQLSSDQETRDTWTVAILSQKHVQFWYLKKSQHKCKCTPFYSFSLSTTSPGFQMWHRWLASTSQVGTSLNGAIVQKVTCWPCCGLWRCCLLGDRVWCACLLVCISPFFAGIGLLAPRAAIDYQVWQQSGNVCDSESAWKLIQGWFR